MHELIQRQTQELTDTECIYTDRHKRRVQTVTDTDRDNTQAGTRLKRDTHTDADAETKNHPEMDTGALSG